MTSSTLDAVSLAAVADRCARPRTSSATTANPSPACPALAASTAAFNASRLVWKAISSMVLMMPAMAPLADLIASIAEIISRMSRCPVSAEPPHHRDDRNEDQAAGEHPVHRGCAGPAGIRRHAGGRCLLDDFEVVPHLRLDGRVARARDLH